MSRRKTYVERLRKARRNMSREDLIWPGRRYQWVHIRGGRGLRCRDADTNKFVKNDFCGRLPGR